MAVYILESKGQNGGVKVMVQRQEMTKTVVASQNLEYELRASKAILVVTIFAAYAGEIWSKSGCLRIGSTYTLEIQDGALI